MTAQAVSRRKARGDRRARARARLTLPLVGIILLVAAAAAFVAYVLWPTWPSEPVALDAPAIPITIAGVLFDVPPAAIREAVQRHPGQHERIDLYFEWPALTPAQPDSKTADKEPIDADNAAAAATATEAKRLFVTIAGLGPVLPPLERLRTIYPRYIEAQAATGPDERVACLLEEAAHRVRSRGDAAGAVTALLRAADLTPPGPSGAAGWRRRPIWARS